MDGRSMHSLRLTPNLSIAKIDRPHPGRIVVAVLLCFGVDDSRDYDGVRVENRSMRRITHPSVCGPMPQRSTVTLITSE